MDEQAAARMILPTIAETLEGMQAQIKILHDEVKKLKDDLHKLKSKEEY